ncbi:unnamed protein product [Brassica rapa]|nr:uncharacterized protein LOC106379007 [Brassica napus]CAF1921399.1 unnamed protein product [Brassica napus]CAG7896033.1 unnamed protein product [Brassica rapa]
MAETILFWDFSGCPVPEGLPVNNAVSNIEYSIRVTGCRNLMMSRSFFVYCDAFKMCDVLGNIYFPFPMRHAGTKEERRKKVFVDFMGKAIGHRQPLNLVVIMEDISEHPEILHALEFCKGRKNINILLSQPRLDLISKELLSSVGALWLWNSLCLAECPLTAEDIEGKGEGHIKGEGRRRQRQRQRQRRRILGAQLRGV